MPVKLITGQPGAGKTLFTLDELRKITDRDIYYNGIPDLKLPWKPIEDVKAWQELPDGSIVVVDECWRYFPVRSGKHEIPEHIAALRTHRHRGFDFYLICQSPLDVDVALRRLVQTHQHVTRIAGQELARVFTWPRVCEKPNDQWERKGALDTQERKFPTDVYEIYKSADIHTIKKSTPRGLFRLAIIALITLALIVASFMVIYDMMTPDDASGPASPGFFPSSSSLVGSPGGSLSGNSNQPDPVQRRRVDVDDYAFTQTSRVPGNDWTAPRFDELMQPKTVPVPSCMMLADACRCYSQQATRMYIEDRVCRHIVANGFFDVTRDPDGRNDRDRDPIGEVQDEALAEIARELRGMIDSRTPRNDQTQ